MDNTTKPTGSVNNVARVSDSETWDTWTIAWQDETRTWDRLRSKMGNTSKVSPSMNNTPKP